MIMLDMYMTILHVDPRNIYNPGNIHDNPRCLHSNPANMHDNTGNMHDNPGLIVTAVIEPPSSFEFEKTSMEAIKQIWD